MPVEDPKVKSIIDKAVSELFEEIPNYPFDEFVFECADDTKFEFIENMSKKLSKQYEISNLDGLRIDFKDGWILVRASNTGPRIRLYIEATSQKRFEELKNEFINLFSEELEKW